MQTTPAIPMTPTASLERLAAVDTANPNASPTLSVFSRGYLNRFGMRADRLLV